jgi:hypothetical protein
MRRSSTFLRFPIGNFVVMARRCSRQLCRETASITLTYQYGRAIVWIDDLAEDADPHAYDLCERHGKRITPPSGWRLEDRRNRFRAAVGNRLAG